MSETWSQRREINWESYDKYNDESLISFYSIEKAGIKISKQLSEKSKKHISDEKLFSNYSLYTSTGRPSK